QREAGQGTAGDHRDGRALPAHHPTATSGGAVFPDQHQLRAASAAAATSEKARPPGASRRACPRGLGSLARGGGMRTLLFLVCAFGCGSSQPGGTSPNQGVITVDSRSYQSGGVTYGSGSVSAGFYREVTDPYLGCTTRSFGACQTRISCQPVHG